MHSIIINIRDANVEDFGIKIGGRLISNLRYADDTALCADNHEDICTLLNNINEEGKIKKYETERKEDKSYVRWKGPV